MKMYSAVFAITLSVVNLIASEFLPVSLLTPMAQDLGISEGIAGQAITATAFAAILSSLFVTTATRGVDRRVVVLTFSLLMALSNLLVALAPNFFILSIGRILLGVSLGGFWSISTSLAMRLVPESKVPKALSIIFSGVSIAMVLAPPLGSFFGEIVGWRGVFSGAAVLSVACLIWQARVLPPMSAPTESEGHGILAVARRPRVGMAMLAIFCGFAGQFAFFTYMRPFYENVPHFGVSSLSAVLLAFGIANCIGTLLSARMIRSSLKRTLVAAPLMMGVSAAGLVAFGSFPLTAAVFTVIWGFMFGWLPVAWSTWIARNLSDDAENAGGLQVAVIQLAAAMGAGTGGYLLEAGGPTAPIALAAAMLFVAAGIVLARVSSNPNRSKSGASLVPLLH
jgi:DHA1 family purine ribonucleoside efflux pump-like MFS transporter